MKKNIQKANMMMHKIKEIKKEKMRETRKKRREEGKKQRVGGKKRLQTYRTKGFPLNMPL